MKDCARDMWLCKKPRKLKPLFKNFVGGTDILNYFRGSGFISESSTSSELSAPWDMAFFRGNIFCDKSKRNEGMFSIQLSSNGSLVQKPRCTLGIYFPHDARGNRDIFVFVLELETKLLFASLFLELVSFY